MTKTETGGVRWGLLFIVFILAPLYVLDVSDRFGAFGLTEILSPKPPVVHHHENPNWVWTLNNGAPPPDLSSWRTVVSTPRGTIVQNEVWESCDYAMKTGVVKDRNQCAQH